MRDVNKAVIKAAEAYYLSSGETDQHNALMDAVQVMLADRAAREIAPIDITEEPPIGSRVRDCDGDVWRRGTSGWGINRSTGLFRWDSWVRQYAPLTLLDLADE